MDLEVEYVGLEVEHHSGTVISGYYVSDKDGRLFHGPHDTPEEAATHLPGLQAALDAGLPLVDLTGSVRV